MTDLKNQARSLSTYSRLFISYARDYGFLNAAICALYKLFPCHFVALNRVLSRHGGGSASLRGAYYKDVFDSVFDDKTWLQERGVDKPYPSKDQRDCFIWFVPDWRNVWGGGHFTLFRFAQHLANRGNLRQIIFVYDNVRHASPIALQDTLDSALPKCSLEVIIDAAQLPRCAAAFATTWQSAYSVKAFPYAERKFYFMQDYESLFYPYGTASAQANNTYSFGFTGITGGGWLKSCYESHGGRAKSYVFATDRNIFYPVRADARVRSRVSKVFFYGRPSTERRCFDLGITALKLIANKYPDIELIIAGLDLQAEPPFKATLLGNLSLEETGRLYRQCDLGIAFSATNLSYLPVELMACGVPVISNRGPQVEWYCRHLENAYLVDPTPAAVLRAVEILCADEPLRQKLAEAGVKKTSLVTWESEIDRVYDYIYADPNEKGV